MIGGMIAAFGKEVIGPQEAPLSQRRKQANKKRRNKNKHMQRALSFRKSLGMGSKHSDSEYNGQSEPVCGWVRPWACAAL